MTAADLSPLRRESGGFAMLAVDQREALRTMFAANAKEPVTDEQLRDFKLDAIRTLSPHASAVLVDRQFALDEAIATNAVADSCGLIAAADHFSSAYGELVGDSAIDPAVDPATYAARGVKALKLLIICRPDQDPEPRVEMAEDFIRRCRSAGLISIIEPLSRRPVSGGSFDWNAGVLRAAAELGALGADLYKAEVPFHAQESEAAVRDACATLNGLIASEWVVLSSGVPEHLFPTAVRWACAEGASGFLAGRAVWASTLGKPDVAGALRTEARQRLNLLCDVVDEAVLVRPRKAPPRILS